MQIYKITNLINNKIYVGKTKFNVSKRFDQHIKGSKNTKSRHYICRTINKYGKQNFIIEEIEHCDSPLELNEREKYWIKTLNSMSPNGYNLSPGGDGPISFRSSLKGKKLSFEHINHIVEGMRNMSPEQKEKMKTSGAGNKNPFYGKKHLEESKQKNREKHLKKNLSVTTIEKMSSAKKGKTYEEIFGEEKGKEMKQKKSKEVTGRKATEEAIYNMSVAQSGHLGYMKENIIQKNQLEKLVKV